MAITKQFNKKITILLSFLFIFLIFYRISSLWNSQFPDFSVFYFVTKGAVNGIDPYKNPTLFTGFGYPPFTIFAYLPFILIPFAISQKAFLIVNVFLFLGIIFESLYIVKKLNLRNFLLFSIFSSLSFPTKFTFGMGQSNFLALLFLLLSYVFFTRQKPIKSSIFLVISLIVKPLFVFLILFFLLTKQWKILLYTLFIMLVVLLASTIMFGYGSYIYYTTKMVPHLMNLQGREIYYNQGITGFVSRFIINLNVRKVISFFSSLLLTLIFYTKSKIKQISANYLFSLIIIILVLLDSLSWQHHFVFLTFPFIYLYFQINKQKKHRKLFLILYSLSYILISLNLANPGEFTSLLGKILLSHAFFGALLLLLINLFLKTYEK